ncbi:Uncharacterised protein [uncultured archaeon]|nr:Uncharacterised protein [uncultured archaeon]
MKNFLEKMFTESMTQYPYKWIGNQEDGFVTRYCDTLGFRLNNAAPEVGGYVLTSWDDNSQAYIVAYSNPKTGRLRVKPSNFHIEYNAILREHRKDPKHSPVDPSGSKITLVKST